MLGLIAPAVMAVHSVLTKRRVDVLAGLVVTALILSVGLSLLTGSPRTLLARDGLVTAAIGGWMIFTLVRTPYFLSALRLFTGGTLREQINAAWGDTPAFRQGGAGVHRDLGFRVAAGRHEHGDLRLHPADRPGPADRCDQARRVDHPRRGDPAR